MAPLETLLLLLDSWSQEKFILCSRSTHYDTWIPALEWGRGRDDSLPSVQEEVEGWRAAGQGHPAPRDRASSGMKCLDLGLCSKSRAPYHLDMDMCKWSNPTVLPSLQGQVQMGPSGHLVYPTLCG